MFYEDNAIIEKYPRFSKSQVYLIFNPIDTVTHNINQLSFFEEMMNELKSHIGLTYPTTTEVDKINNYIDEYEEIHEQDRLTFHKFISDLFKRLRIIIVKLQKYKSSREKVVDDVEIELKLQKQQDILDKQLGREEKIKNRMLEKEFQREQKELNLKLKNEIKDKKYQELLNNQKIKSDLRIQNEHNRKLELATQKTLREDLKKSRDNTVKLEKEYKKQLRETHCIKMKNEKEERIIFNNTIITCECGGTHTRSGSSNHLISNAHRNNMNIINQYLDKNDAVLRSKNIQVDNNL